ncbi:hypothetical protein [Psychroflexus aestuariivivens]|uniref:hypothetical protein n=1 Tax=Psychroflexus aestuariivivens TaxID=1795040 RepID=UPI000FD75106|nr:hypothetical protein [Psychroflexus aestuariivivens]
MSHPKVKKINRNIDLITIGIIISIAIPFLFVSDFISKSFEKDELLTQHIEYFEELRSIKNELENNLSLSDSLYAQKVKEVGLNKIKSIEFKLEMTKSKHQYTSLKDDFYELIMIAIASSILNKILRNKKKDLRKTKHNKASI